MHRHEFLPKLHEVYKPRTYFEIGIRDGLSLRFSRVPTVAVDPAYKVTAEINCDLHMLPITSDEFFTREDPFAHLKGEKVDFAFIDGMHLFEYALRDFINTEKYLAAGSVVVIDDVLPRNVDESARDRHTHDWAGDVYKVLPVLAKYRPDLTILVLDTRLTGVMVVLGTDPTNTVLSDKYDEILAEHIVDDPQPVPEGIIDRRSAFDAQEVIDAGFWAELVEARDSGAALTGEDVRALVEKHLALKPLEFGAPVPPPAKKRIDWAPALKKLKAEEARAAAAAVAPGSATPEAARAAAVKQQQVGASAVFLRKLAKKAPFLRKLPGAQAVARKFR